MSMSNMVVTEHQEAQLGEGTGQTLVPAQMFPEAVTEEDAADHRTCWLPVPGVQLGTRGSVGEH